MNWVIFFACCVIVLIIVTTLLPTYRNCDPGFVIIKNEYEKKWIINKITSGFVKQAINDGVIKVKDDPHPYDPHLRVLKIEIKIVEPC